MLDVLGLILPLFGLIAIGYGAARIAPQPIEAGGWLNIFIIYVALPALFFQLLSKTPIDQLANWRFIGADVAITFAIFILAFILGLIACRGRIGEATIAGLGAAYGNIGYMGPAIALLALGEKAAIPVALIVCFENILHFVTTPALMALSGRKNLPVHRLLLDILRQIFFHPFILATMAGIAAAAIQFKSPLPLERLVTYLAQAAAPCALFALGLSLALRPLSRVPGELGFIIPIKLLLHPAAIYFGLSYAGDFDPVWVYTAVLLAALPTATNVFVLAQQYDVWIERSSATILVTTALSAITVTLLLYAITTGALPPDFFPGVAALNYTIPQ